jgi:DNA-binding response OmpR family regulator
MRLCRSCFRARRGEEADKVPGLKLGADDYLSKPCGVDELLARMFAAHPRETFTRERLLASVWGSGFHGTLRTVDQYVAQLRRKVESTPEDPRHILTVHGIGYRHEP